MLNIIVALTTSLIYRILISMLILNANATFFAHSLPLFGLFILYIFRIDGNTLHLMRCLYRHTHTRAQTPKNEVESAMNWFASFGRCAWDKSQWSDYWYYSRNYVCVFIKSLSSSSGWRHSIYVRYAVDGVHCTFPCESGRFSHPLSLSLSLCVCGAKPDDDIHFHVIQLLHFCTFVHQQSENHPSQVHLNFPNLLNCNRIDTLYNIHALYNIYGAVQFCKQLCPLYCIIVHATENFNWKCQAKTWKWFPRVELSMW